MRSKPVTNWPDIIATRLFTLAADVVDGWLRFRGLLVSKTP